MFMDQELKGIANDVTRARQTSGQRLADVKAAVVHV